MKVKVDKREHRAAEKLNLEYLVENELLVCCPLISSKQFVNYCKERDILISEQQLERFDELGIFKPIARFNYPKIKRKIEYLDNGKQYRSLGILQENEKWEGDIFEEYAQYWPGIDSEKDWFTEGLMWDPNLKPFIKWDLFDKDLAERKAECYYSIFQIYPLNTLIKATRFELRSEWWVSYSPEEIKSKFDQILKWAEEIIVSYQNIENVQHFAALICQVLSNRYYPKTQSDRRSITIPGGSMNPQKKWDWYEYSRNYKPKEILEYLGISIEKLKKLHQRLRVQIRYIDPLRDWYGLVSFVKLEKKKKLKGRALLAQSLYPMIEMIRFFIEDITGEDLPEPHESQNWRKERFYGKEVKNNELRYLEFLTNQFGLNPKPKTILVVEGEGEAVQFPRLSEQLLGYPFSRLGIDIYNLEGIGGFTGKKKREKYGALEKFIDEYHRRQTIIFVVLDNEGRAAKIKEELVKAPSRFYPSRTITSEELIHLWNKNIEFDNFSHQEIAEAMTELCEKRYTFDKGEIATCEQSFNSGKSNPLGKLYEEKLDYELPKPELLSILFRMIIVNGEKEFDEHGNALRPVVKLMRKISQLSVRNYQPTCFETQQKNQESGFLGEQLGKLT